MNSPIKKIVILGGGTAGWMAAAMLCERYKNHDLTIELVESPDISTVGVGEATVPGILKLHHHLGISEREFIKATNATFKLGIEFRDWNKLGGNFFHPFAAFGTKINKVDFYQCWLKLHKEGHDFNLEDFCLSVGLARSGRFSQPDHESQNPLTWYGYAYHFDASHYAKILRSYAEARGVVRHLATVISVNKNANTGFIESLVLDSGKKLGGDLFIDCSGFRSVLIEQEMQAGYEDWSHWLPCDRAVVVQSESTTEPMPYTISTAMTAGWRWRIPLQTRVGNGYVYSSNYISDDEAQNDFLSCLDAKPIADPRVIKFKAGMRPTFWKNNCVAIGLASGFVEPLESTSISLMQTGVEKLMEQIPDLVMTEKGIAAANKFNLQEYEAIRDFIILHYKSSGRRDSDFWRYVSEMEVPNRLREKVSAFMENGRVLLHEKESFMAQSWLAMYNGFNQVPKACNAEVAALDTKALVDLFVRMKSAISNGVQCAPSQKEFMKSVYEN